MSWVKPAFALYCTRSMGEEAEGVVVAPPPPPKKTRMWAFAGLLTARKNNVRVRATQGVCSVKFWNFLVLLSHGEVVS